jgi:hypothetical protein
MLYSLRIGPKCEMERPVLKGLDIWVAHAVQAGSFPKMAITKRRVIDEGIRTANEICLQGFSDEERSQLEDLLSRMACTLSNTPGDEFRVHFSKVE